MFVLYYYCILISLTNFMLGSLDLDLFLYVGTSQMIDETFNDIHYLFESLMWLCKECVYFVAFCAYCYWKVYNPKTP